MLKRAIHAGGLLALLAMAALTTLRAQDEKGKPPVYTYISEWTAPRAQWGEFLKNDDDEKPMLDKLVADGTLIAYGSFVNLIHQEGEPTHGSWMTATSEGRLAKALEAQWSRPGLTSPVLAASKHWDYITVSRIHNSRPGTWTGGYLSGSQWQVKPGDMREFNELEKSTLIPVFDKLVADGVVNSYSLDTEDNLPRSSGSSSSSSQRPTRTRSTKLTKRLVKPSTRRQRLAPRFVLWWTEKDTATSLIAYAT